MSPDSAVTREITAVPFTDLGVMAGEVWPEIEQEYLSCLLDGAYMGGRRSRPSSGGGPPTAARSMPSAWQAEPTPWSSA